MKNKPLILLLFFSVFVSMQLWAQTLIAYIPLPKVLEENAEAAPYNQLMSTILPRINERHHTLFVPSARANAMINSDQLDCIFPVVSKGYKRNKNMLKSQAVNKITAHLFSLQSPILDAHAPGLIIVYQRGMYFGELFSHLDQNKLIAVEDEEAAIKVLNAGRANAYLAYYPDVLQSISEAQMSILNIHKGPALLTTEDKLECINSAKNANFIKKFNGELTAMQKSGELKKLLGNYLNDQQY